ncbi:pyocin activator PrtN family protein [Thiothrix sp.]|jgi:hypothetical protein|uniref:pyocin activator PrtN family protein n=1 Tax=Thiothrix sp. TaxID=1032 RepID=UPI00257F859A|nr:pyocin activator PrtN family protein [Thiothrix sp.]
MKTEPIPLDSLAPHFNLSYRVLKRKVSNGEIRLPTFRLHGGQKAKLLVSPKAWEKYLKDREKEAH